MKPLSRLSFLVCLLLPVTSFAATFTVTTNADSGAGSLREAIVSANANPGLDTIAFNIGGGGPQVIEVATALPHITDAVIIDGTTQPGFAGSPIVTLDGPLFNAGGSGLTVNAEDMSTIRGLVIVDFGESGIEILRGGARVVGNYIGIDASGSVAKGNMEGVRVMNDVDGSIIGGAAAADRNVISGNRGGAIMFWAITDGASDDNVIRGNIIGLDATGTVAVGNRRGIDIRGGERNIIGGTAPGEGNIVSGNQLNGVDIYTYESFAAVGTVVQGNRIGTNITGTAVIGNGNIGLRVFGARATVIGGAASGARNIISGNGRTGVAVSTICFTETCAPSEETLVEGNLIGTDVGGTQDFGNVSHGIGIVGARDTTIRANVISGNGGAGVNSFGTTGPDGIEYRPLGIVIVSNRIGTNAAGTAALPNTADGVLLSNSQDGIVGGTGAQRNVISGNGSHGIRVASGGNAPSTNNAIRGNLIGTASDGITPLGNAGNGVLLGADDPAQVTGHVVGGTAAGEGNVIRFNGEAGIASTGGRGNRFLANSIDLNTALGIDLLRNGVTPNDALDADTGPNDLQNYPLLTSATVNGSTDVRGTLHSTPLRTFRVEFFTSQAADPSGYGEGRTFLGFTTAVTDAAGNAVIDATLPAVAVGSVVTSTATDLTALNTSEFSNAVTAAAPPLLNVSDVEVTEGSSGDVSATFTVTLTAPSAIDVSFQYATANGTATAPGDYTATSGTGLIPAGSLSTIITVPVHGDTTAELTETFVVNISGVTGAAAGDAQGQATITNDDAAVAAAAVPTASEWALIAMTLLLALAGASATRWG